MRFFHTSSKCIQSFTRGNNYGQMSSNWFIVLPPPPTTNPLTNEGFFDCPEGRVFVAQRLLVALARHSHEKYPFLHTTLLQVPHLWRHSVLCPLSTDGPH